MTTLYRKYRPSTFADVEAQEHIVTTLKNEVSGNLLAHAYIFAGPRGVGKTTLARLLAKAVICTNRKDGDGEPCNTCANCLDVNAGKHLDIVEIDAASHTGVDNVRENIIDSARFEPSRAKYKIFIIDEVHMLSGSAFNALLKTLEEPPKHVIFILATTELAKLPATVVSRCQRFQFKKIPNAAMITKLKKICAEENVKVETNVLERIAHLSDGALRDAESILGQVLSLGKKKITGDDVALMLPVADAESLLTIIEGTLSGDSGSALMALNTLSENGTEAGQLFNDLIEMLRAGLVYQATKNDSALAITFGAPTIKRLKALTTTCNSAQLVTAIENAIFRRSQLRLSPYPYLPVELFIIAGVSTHIPSLPTGTTIAVATKPAPAPVTPNPNPVAAPVEITPTPATPVLEVALEPKPATLGATIKSAISNLTGHTEPPTTSLEEVKKRWPELVQKIGAQNHALTFIISMAKVQAVAEDGLHLTVPYTLHRDKLMDNKIRRVIEDCIELVFNERIRFHCDLEAAAPAPAVDADVLSMALEFGGEVVA